MHDPTVHDPTVHDLDPAERPTADAATHSANGVAAHDVAEAAARAAEVAVRELHDVAAFAAASELLAVVWGTSVDASPLPSDLLASLAHAGSCLIGAYAGPDLVGFAVCLSGAPRSRQVYSVIAAAAPTVAGRGVGAALKFAQRAWSLDRGADHMVWTFDPLVRRNAHFNINKLGARAVTYLPDFYPPMHDAINRLDLTDRLVADWDLSGPAPALASGLAGERDAIAIIEADAAQRPVLRDAGRAEPLAVQVPSDIEALRRSDPALARQWRLSVRDALGSRLSDGYRIVGFARTGAYILKRGTDV